MINPLNTSFLFLAEAIAPSTIAKEQALSSDALIAVAVIGFWLLLGLALLPGITQSVLLVGKTRSVQLSFLMLNLATILVWGLLSKDKIVAL